MKKITILLLIVLAILVGLGFEASFVYAKKMTSAERALVKAEKKKVALLKKQNSTKCTDSDKGKNYYKKGKAKGIYSGASGSTSGNGAVFGTNYSDNSGMKRTIYTDHCQGTQLNEAYCSGGKLQAIGVICANGCKKGACIR